MLIKIYSAAPVGIEAVKVTIEVHSKPGFEFIMVGLPDTSVKESQRRSIVRSPSIWLLRTSRKKARSMTCPWQ